MILIGLAGRIGAGKSTVAARLAEHGASVIDADRLAHEVLETQPVRDAIAARFGAGFLDDSGRVRRPALAAAVFGPSPEHAAALADLEAIVHPVVRQRIEMKIAELRDAAGSRDSELVIVLDVPLLVQAGWAARCDRILEVVCDQDHRHHRLSKRGWTADAIAWRDAAWSRRMPAGGLREAVNPARICTVDTSSVISYTHEQVDRFWHGLRTTLSQGGSQPPFRGGVTGCDDRFPA